jgi:hypothetical protein
LFDQIQRLPIQQPSREVWLDEATPLRASVARMVSRPIQLLVTLRSKETSVVSTTVHKPFSNRGAGLSLCTRQQDLEASQQRGC